MSDLTSTTDLTAPLAPPRVRRRVPAWLARPPLFPILATLVGGALVFVVGWIAVVRDPMGGEPVAVATIAMAPATSPKGGDAPAAEDGAGHGEATHDAHHDGGHGAVADARTETAGQMEDKAGVVVVRGGGAAPPAAMVVKVPDAMTVATLAPPDPGLAERGRQGSLPKIGPDGRRPADVYARPVIVPPGLKADAPRIALLIGGMGISPAGTADAVAKLPPGVTLAFAPYGTDLDRTVQKARADGHEVLLQAPMEPFDYPDSDPGPQTLLTSAAPAANLDKLRWQMSRFAGYVGVTNYMGGKFTASREGLAPVLKEIADRGLLYADDGSSPRSLALEIAGTLGLPSPKADIVLDAAPTPAAIDGALARLEQLARDKGSAFAVGTGLPLTVQHVADWAKTLEKRGVMLVPVSALAKPR